MALFKILKGNQNDLGKSTSTNSSQTHEGWCYFAQDSGCFYVDTDSNESPILGTNRIQLNAGIAYNNVYNITASTNNGALIYSKYPMPGATASTTEITVYTHPTGNGNNHIPSGGSTGNWLKYNSAGTAEWASIDWSDIGNKPNQATRWPKWSEVTDKPTTFTPSSHTHAVSIAADTTSTNQLSLAANTQYKLTAGGTNFIFKTPADTTYSFTNKAVTLAWNTTHTIATVGGVDITLKMPANPNTDHYAWSDITSKPTFSGGTTTLAWNTTHTIANVGGNNVIIKMPANPNTNTTYTFAKGSTNGAFTVTPSGGTAQTVSICGLGSAAYTASTAYAAASHTHAYAASSHNHNRAGVSKSWYQGRDSAIIKTTSYSGYDAILSMKTTNGDWAMGVYSSNTMYWTYITDTNYNANANTVTAQMSLTSGGVLTTTQVKNAVWNDYAECRQVETEEPGYCVTETSMGTMIKTTKRLQAGCKLTSDTYGTCMGETATAKTPIAVAGRVLAYPYRAREEYPLGAAVCSAPNGTIDIMTRDEIMKYPERIIGTVSEIPNYEIWHAGQDGEKDIKVNGRIWVYIK